jgi:hypothetical protein
MDLYQKHHLQSGYDLAHCRTLFKKYEELDLNYENNPFNHPAQYFIRWNDDSTFWFKVLKYRMGGRSIVTHYSTRYQYLVRILGSDKKPIFIIQRKLGYYDLAPMFLFGGISLFFAFITSTHRVVGYLAFLRCCTVFVFFSIGFFPLVGEPDYEAFKKLIEAEEIKAEAAE